MKKRLLSILLCVCMALSLPPTTVWATEYSSWEAATDEGIVLNVDDTVTIDGTTYIYKGDASSSGIELHTLDGSYTALIQACCWKAGNGYALFTPSTTDPATNAKLELHNVVISTSSSALSLPSAEPVDITVTGDNTLKANGSGNVITTNGQALNISGSGNLTLAGSYYGINVNGSGAVGISIEGDLIFDTQYQPISTNSDITVLAKSITSKSGYYFSGNNVSLTATDGDIVFDDSDKINKTEKIQANGNITLNAQRGKVDIAHSGNSYALKSSNGSVTITANDDISINKSIDSTSGYGGITAKARTTITSVSGSIMNFAQFQCISAEDTVTLNAAKDVTLNSTDYSAISTIRDVNITAGGKLSSISSYGLITGVMTIKANEVSIEGTIQSGIQSNSVTIKNPTDGNCKSVNIIATSQYNSFAAIKSYGDVTVKTDDLFIRGNNSAKAIDAPGNVTIGDAGMIIGTYSIGTDNISEGIVRGRNGGDVSVSGLDLSTPPTETTIYTTSGGYLRYNPASGETPDTLTLHNANIEVNTNGRALGLGENTILKLEGTNSITNSNADAGVGIGTVEGCKPVTIQGSNESSLTVSAWQCTRVGNLTISGVNIFMNGSLLGMVAEGNVTLKDRAQVHVTSSYDAALFVDKFESDPVNLTVEGDSSLIVDGDAYISGNLSVSGSSIVRARKNRFIVNGDVSVTGSHSKLTVDGKASFEIIEGTITIGSDATIENNGVVEMKPNTTVEQIKAWKLTGNGVVKVVTEVDADFGFPTAWDTYSNSGVLLNQISGGLDVTSGDHSGKSMEHDGYTFDNNTLTLGNTYISGGITLPDHATVNTTANSFLNGGITFQSGALCDLTFLGNGSLTVDGDITNAIGGSMTVTGGADIIVHGIVNIGASGGTDGTLSVTGAGTTLNVTSSLGYAVFFETINIGNGASLVATVEGNNSVGVRALSGGVNITGGSTLTTGCDFGVYINGGKLTVDDNSKLITNGAVAPFCIIDTTSAKPQSSVLSLSGIPSGTEIKSVIGTTDFYGHHYAYWSLVRTGGSLQVSEENSDPVTLSGAIGGERLQFIKANGGNPGGNPVGDPSQNPGQGPSDNPGESTDPNPSDGNAPDGNTTGDTNPDALLSNLPTIVKQSMKGEASDGILTLHITEVMAKDAIKEAKALARKTKNAANGIALEYTAKKVTGYHSLNIKMDAKAIDRLREAKVKYIKVSTAIFEIALDTQTILQIDKQSSGMVTVSAMKQDKLSKDAKKIVKNRPVFKITANYQKKNKIIYMKNFGKGMVTIGIPYQAAAIEKKASVFGYIIDNKGKASVLSNSIYNDGKVIFKRNSLSTYGVGYQASTPEYKDTIKHIAKEDIDYVTSRDLIARTSPTMFAPNTTITRATFLVALVKLAGVDVSSYKTSSFTDVKNSDPAMPYIEWAYRNKIVKGIGNGKFGPQQRINRQGMAVMMHNFVQASGYKLPVLTKDVTLSDSMKISASTKKAVIHILQAGLMESNSKGEFNPKGTVTRANASTMLRHFVELVIIEGTIK